MDSNPRKSRREGLEFSWILFGMNHLQDQRQTIMHLKEQGTSILDGKNSYTVTLQRKTVQAVQFT